MLCQLDCKGANTAGPCRDEHLLTGPKVGAFLQRLPRGEPDHRNRGSLHEVQIGRLQRGSALRYHREFGNRPRTKIEDAGEDGITYLEASHVAADLRHHTGQIAAQRGRQLEMQNRFERPGRNHVVDRVQAGSVDLYQQLVGLQRRAGNIGEPDLGRLAITFEDECFHDLIFHLLVFRFHLVGSVSEEVQNLGHKVPVVLENAAVPGIRVDRQLGIRQTASHVV
ncbi:hypothetical protein D3C78_793250 [compost metagenome]